MKRILLAAVSSFLFAVGAGACSDDNKSDAGAIIPGDGGGDGGVIGGGDGGVIGGGDGGTTGDDGGVIGGGDGGVVIGDDAGATPDGGTLIGDSGIYKARR